MTMRVVRPAVWLLFALALLGSLGQIVRGAEAQPDSHEQHDPAEKKPEPESPQPAAPASGGMGGMMEGGESGMGKMMEHMGAPPKELYPSLMALSKLSHERNATVERLAQERVTESKEQISAAAKRLSDAAARGDYPAMEQAASQMREALAQFESGLAARRALSEGKDPRSVALQWFRQEMNLLPEDATKTEGPFGLGWFHRIVILILGVFAVAMIGMYFRKMRRAEALVTQLALGSAAASAAAGTGAPLATAATSSTLPTLPVAPPVVAAKWSGQLRVARIFQETSDVKTFRLAQSEASEFLPFTFDPGQFLTVSVNVNGKNLKRSYSLSSSPCCQGWCEFAVKHVTGGQVSRYLHEQVREGDLLNIAGPSGRFTFRGKEAPSVVFIAGGIGITPFMSSIRYLTDQSWQGEIFLIYACGSMRDIIFRQELDYLQQRHPTLHVTVTLSSEQSPEWTGARGYVSKELILKTVPDIAARRIHMCGPPPMMESVKALLAQIGVAPEQVKTELFLTPEPSRAPTTEKPRIPTPAPGMAQVPVCTFARSEKSAPLPPDETVLEASEDAGVYIDYSCRQGYCGVCKVKLLTGQVTMAVDDALDEQDKAQNIILACQAKATADITVEA